MYALFPTLVYEANLDLDTNFYENKAQEICKTLKLSSDWRCDTLTTLNHYDLINDKDFTILLEHICNEVSIFSKEYGVSGTVKPIDAWINYATPGAFQEYHIHTGSHFSVAYYIKANADSGNIVFRSFEADTDMYTLPVTTLTPASYKTMSLPPQEGKLYVFRSNLKHMVEKNNSNQDRISISANFIIV